jgi:hypothetical protein
MQTHRAPGLVSDTLGCLRWLQGALQILNESVDRGERPLGDMPSQETSQAGVFLRNALVNMGIYTSL